MHRGTRYRETFDTYAEADTWERDASRSKVRQGQMRHFCPRIDIMYPMMSRKAVGPSPLHFAVILGIERLQRVDFDLASDMATFVEQGLRGVQERPQAMGPFPTF